MIRGFMFEAIIKLWKDGKSKKAISRAVNHDIKTIRKIIKLHQQSLTSVTYKPRASLLDNFKVNIQEYVEQDLSNVRVFEEIRRFGYLRR